MKDTWACNDNGLRYSINQHKTRASLQVAALQACPLFSCDYNIMIDCLFIRLLNRIMYMHLHLLLTSAIRTFYCAICCKGRQKIPIRKGAEVECIK